MTSPKKKRASKARTGNQSARKYEPGQEPVLRSCRVPSEIAERLDKDAWDRGMKPAARLAQIVTERYSDIEEDPES